MEKMNRRDFLRLAGAAAANSLVQEMAGSEKLKGPESIPDEANVLKVFETLQGERECQEGRRLFDHQGVYLWEVSFPIEGGTAEFSYMRAGRYEVGGSATSTKVYVFFYDEDGMPEGGHDIAEYVDGSWKITDEDPLG